MTLDSCSSVAGSIGNVLDLYDFAAYETDIPHMTGVGAPDWAISACRATLDAGRGAKDARHEPRRLAASP